MTRSEIVSAYRDEVQRCTDITMRRIETLKATHTGGREEGLAQLARIGGAFRAHLMTLAEACEKAAEKLDEPEFPRLVME